MNERIHDYVEITSLKDMMYKTRESFGDRPFVKYKTKIEGEIDTITYNEFFDEVEALGTAFINGGLKEKRIAVISENRYEWAVTYFATVCGTGIIVPLDRALPENEIRSLIERSEVEAIVYSSKYDEIMKTLIITSIWKM